MHGHFVKHVQAALTGNSTGFLTPVSIPELGRRGCILAVKIREDTGGVATQGDFWIADSNGSPMTSAAPKDEHKFYELLNQALTASSTTASKTDNMGGSWIAPYEVSSTTYLAVGCNIDSVSGAGTFTIYVDVWALVTP